MTAFEDTFRIIDSLNENEVNYIIVGGTATIIHGLPRMTENIDLVIKMNENNVDKLSKALKSIFDDENIDEITYDELKEFSVIRYISPSDDMIDIKGNWGVAFDYDKIQKERKEISGREVIVATSKALLAMKSNTYREKDKIDVIYLRELLK
jgi:hypothetical protein